MDFIKNVISKPTTVYLSTKEMSLYEYIQYLNTSDLLWFSNFYSKKYLKKPKDSELDHAMTVIFGEILSITKNYKVIEKFNDIDKLEKLKVKYNDVKRLCYYILHFDTRLGREKLVELVDLLRLWKYKISDTKDLITQVENIDNSVENLVTEIKLLEAKLSKVNTEEKKSIESDILDIQLGLELSFKINPKETTLFEWFDLNRRYAEKIEYLQKQQKKN